MGATKEVTLGLGDGEVVVPVREQSAAYLAFQVQRLGLTLSGDLDAENVVGVMFGRGYQALIVLVPELEARMPEWQFAGCSSREALEAGDHDIEALKRAPSAPQIREAFRVGLEVNGLEQMLQEVGKWVDPSLLRAAGNARLAEWLSKASPSSPPTSGASTSNDSGTSAPASDETALSASDD